MDLFQFMAAHLYICLYPDFNFSEHWDGILGFDFARNSTAFWIDNSLECSNIWLVVIVLKMGRKPRPLGRLLITNILFNLSYRRTTAANTEITRTP